MSTPRLKVLCLHGFTSNGAVHAHQLRHIVRALPEYDFVFPDGPHKVDIASKWDMTKAENRLWSELVTSTSTSGHRAWWIATEGGEEIGEYTGVDVSLDAIGDTLQKEGPFHAILGFSQGGCLAGMLCALLQKRAAAPHPLQSHLPRNTPPPLAGIVFSGFKARFPRYRGIYADGIMIPTIHVLGLQDQDVTNEGSQELAALSKQPVIIRHDGGHQIPKKKEDVLQITEFVRRHVVNERSKVSSLI